MATGYDEDEDAVSGGNNEAAPAMLEYLEIANYPLGSAGCQTICEALSRNPSLKTLKLIDCDLRSDSAIHIAQMIRDNKSLEMVDLSYNRHYNGTPITRELTFKTLVQRGLKYNLNLLHLRMDQTHGGPMNRSKIDRQLEISRFRKSYIENKRDPMAIHPAMWCHLLEKVSVKPAATYLFLQDSVATLFAR